MTRPAQSRALEVRVYFEDTDFSGNVYHAAYLKFMERARTEYLRARGIHHAELMASGMAFAVRHMQIDFFAPAHIDDLLQVLTVPAEVRGARIVLSQDVRRGDTVLVRAEVTVALLNEKGRPVRLPEALRRAARE